MCWPRVWFVSKDMLTPRCKVKICYRRYVDRVQIVRGVEAGGAGAPRPCGPPQSLMVCSLYPLRVSVHSKDVGAATCFASSPLSHGWTSLLIHRQIADRIHVVPLRNLYRSVYPRILIRVRSNEPRNPGIDYWDGKSGIPGLVRQRECQERRRRRIECARGGVHFSKITSNRER